MKTKLLSLLSALLLFASQNTSAQRLISDSLLVHYTQQQADNFFSNNGIPVQSNSGFSCYRLVYETLNAQQTDTTIASGLVVVPDTSTCPMAIAMYDHGTVLQRTDVPSFLNSEALIAMLLAAEGYYALAPDYLGLGVSPGFHPYVHAVSEAQAGVDLIFASKAFAANNNIALSPQLFLTGYSQGGHACMATHKLIQQSYSGQLTVTASAPGSGPYYMSGAQAAFLTNDSFYSTPGYIPYLIFAYQSVYGNLYSGDSVSQILQHPYDSILPPLFNEQYDIDTINSLLPDHIDSIVTPAFLSNYFSDSANNPFRIDLRLNDVYAWVPQAPVQMTYCTEDEQVSNQNTLFTYNYFINNGDNTATKIDGGAYMHVACATPAIENMIILFDGLRVAENNLNLAFTVDTTTPDNATITVSVSGGTGYTIHWSTGSSDSTITGLRAGVYSVTVTDAHSCAKVRSVTINAPAGITEVGAASPQLLLFPDPATTQLSIRVANLHPQSINIYDLNGRLVMHENFKQQLDISTLSEGAYMLEVRDTETTLRSRFVKM